MDEEKRAPEPIPEEGDPSAGTPESEGAAAGSRSPGGSEAIAREAPSPREVDADAAVPAPPAGPIVSRRTLVLGGFWGGIAALLTAITGGLGIDFLWPRKVKGFGAPVDVPASTIPAPGGDPVRVVEGRFWLVNLAEGEGGSPGGLLALYQKCPHLGCTVPWRGNFEFAGREGWFRCPCHASTFTKEGGILVSGPSPRPMDTMAIEVKPNGDIVVETGQIRKGGQDNPLRAVPYSASGGQVSSGIPKTPTLADEEPQDTA
jgi:cytochrome b6-f complex iron-sulfur subunit